LNLEKYIMEHALNNVHQQENKFYDVIVDTPKELIEIALNSGYFVSAVLWWDMIPIAECSDLGLTTIKLKDGSSMLPGIPNIRSRDYYFSETSIYDEFDEETTLDKYLEYLDSVKTEYSQYNIYPSVYLEKIT